MNTNELELADKSKIPWRTKMMPDKWYLGLDKGIRFAVKVLHAHGIETCQSCQGGAGHAYEVPSVDFIAGGAGDDNIGFAALHALHSYGFSVRDLSIVWNVHNGLPFEKLWRITLWVGAPQWANRKPAFIHGARATI